MKKIGLLTTLLVTGLLLAGCNKTVEQNPEIKNDTNVEKNYENIISGGYLYKSLDLSNEEDKAEYEQLQNDRNMILKYQTDTSTAVNKFIDVIYDDLLKSCEQYGTGYETMTGTMYERDVCVDTYISDLYIKLKTELSNPRQKYLGDDPVLLSYYNDLNGNHPFVRYFVDLYEFIKNQGYRATGKMPIRPNGQILSENSEDENVVDWESLEAIYLKNGTGFYTYSEGNILETDYDESYISDFKSGLVINGSLLEWIQNEYGYSFPFNADDIKYGTAPDRGGVIIHYNDGYNDYIYQIYREGGGSGEFYLLVRILEDGLRIPIGECGYLLYPRNPMLFGECREWSNFDPLTIFTQEDNLYEYNNIHWLAENLAYFLRYLESTRVLSK